MAKSHRPKVIGPQPMYSILLHNTNKATIKYAQPIMVLKAIFAVNILQKKLGINIAQNNMHIEPTKVGLGGLYSTNGSLRLGVETFVFGIL